MNNLTQAVDPRADITMHRLSLGMRVRELPMIVMLGGNFGVRYCDSQDLDGLVSENSLGRHK